MLRVWRTARDRRDFWMLWMTATNAWTYGDGYISHFWLLLGVTVLALGVPRTYFGRRGLGAVWTSL